MKFTKRLNWYAEHFADIYRTLTLLPTPELRKLRDAATKATTSNCWWAAYDAAQYLLPEIAGELQRRKKAPRKATKRPAKGRGKRS